MSSTASSRAMSMITGIRGARFLSSDSASASLPMYSNVLRRTSEFANLAASGRPDRASNHLSVPRRTLGKETVGVSAIRAWR
eukprot:6327186-Lingulodinium_polyedra.AAC.1